MHNWPYFDAQPQEIYHRVYTAQGTYSKAVSSPICISHKLTLLGFKWMSSLYSYSSPILIEIEKIAVLYEHRIG